MNGAVGPNIQVKYQQQSVFVQSMQCISALPQKI